LLNCGFRIPASAGTDCFLNRVPGRVPGEDRVYVKVEEGFTYQNWIKNLKQGRTFVTNGPVLEFTVEGRRAGDTIALTGPENLQGQGTVSSQYPIQKVEFILNGSVVDGIEVEGGSRTVTLDQSVSVQEGGWLAVRAYGPPNPAQGGKPFFCHSGPIYLEVDGKGAASAEDAQYFLGWIDRLWSEIEERDRILPRHRAEVEAEIEQARGVYRQLAN
ncbi:MAG TPA: CehA/McbA family metallohydrolase, partial [Acidobacteriota bacterium]|nr:CehA/McbA family metallohydrolase [Acidobacteriota bacterium]